MESLEITCEELDRMLREGQPVVVVDCREAWEYETVQLPGAALIPMNETPQRIDEYRAAEAPVVVHCHHGARSLRVVQWLRSQGVENVRSLQGGIDAWSLSVDPSLPRY